VASTQRQESENYQVKRKLICNSSLSHLLEGFVAFESNAQAKMKQAVLDGKLAPVSPDPMITGPLQELTTYAGDLLRDQCALSLHYTCDEVEAGRKFHVSHMGHADAHRVVVLGGDGVLVCSCRKVVWHGLVCRHILSTLRKLNVIGCPMGYFNKRWLSDSEVDLNGANGTRDKHKCVPPGWRGGEAVPSKEDSQGRGRQCGRLGQAIQYCVE
jgi:hypothetical protein